MQTNPTYEKLSDYTLEKLNKFFAETSTYELSIICNVDWDVIDMLTSYPYCVSEELLFKINENLDEELFAKLPKKSS